MGVTKPRTWHGAARESPPTRNGSTVSRSCRRARKLRRGCIGRRPPGSEGPVRGCRDGPLKGRESAGGAAERFGVPQSGRTCTRWASKRRTGRAEPISALIRPGRVPGVPRNPTRGRAERREANREVSPTLKPLESRHRRRADSFVRQKRIKKNVFITQCHLLPTEPCDTTGTLFIEGFIRKNVEFATEECSSEGVICGRIKHCTFKVPFRCTTTVHFFKKPVLRGPIFVPNPPTTETEIFQDTLKDCDVCREPIIGNDPCQQNFTSTEFFNEPVFCELVSASFNETDIHKHPRTCCDDPTEQTFRRITEKVLLTLKIKVLQKQQVGLNAKDIC